MPPLSEYHRRYALLNHQNRAARTYVAMRGEMIVGYYTLANGSVSRDEAPDRVAHGLGRYPVPITLLWPGWPCTHQSEGEGLDADC